MSIMRFDYCPLCGSKLALREAGDDGLTPYCESCQKMRFDMFPSCVIVIVANEYDEIALLHQPSLSDRGVFVSGYITPGESAEEAAMREVNEELGLDTQRLESFGTFWFQKRGQLMHGFVAHVQKQELVCSSELKSAYWFQISDAPEAMFPDWKGNHAWNMFRAYRKEIESSKGQFNGVYLGNIDER